MRNIKKYSEFILEKVYLSKTIFNSYSLIVDPFSGVGIFDLNIRDIGDFKMEIQSYGSPEDQQFIIRIPTELSVSPDGEKIFKNMIEDIIYILNKNRLGFNFSLIDIDRERNLDNLHSIIEVDKVMSIEDLERVAQTTKITNAKVVDTGNLDKMIYQTNESFDNLNNNEQDIIIQIKELVDDHSELLYADDIEDYPTVAIGGGNPYHECKYCGQSEPAISVDGHKTNCKWIRIYNKFDLLKSQLSDSINLRDILDEMEY